MKEDLNLFVLTSGSGIHVDTRFYPDTDDREFTPAWLEKCGFILVLDRLT